MVQEYKEMLKAVNARNTKKVAEAKARKKKRVIFILTIQPISISYSRNKKKQKQKQSLLQLHKICLKEKSYVQYRSCIREA